MHLQNYFKAIVLLTNIHDLFQSTYITKPEIYKLFLLNLKTVKKYLQNLAFFKGNWILLQITRHLLVLF